MKNIFSLFNVLKKNTAMKMPSKGSKGKIYLSLGIIALSCIMIPCCLIVGYVSYVVTQALTTAGAAGNGLLAEVHIMSAFSMIFGMLVIFSVLFFSSDREHLVPLPFKAHEILAAKFLYSYMAESVMEFMILIAMFIGFFMAFKLSIVGVISAIIGVILIPLLPMLYCAIISLLLMSALKSVKSAKIFNHMSTICLLIFIGLFLLSFKDMGTVNIDNYVASLAGNSNLFANVLNKVFFTVPLLLAAIEKGSILHLLLYILGNIAVLAIMLLIGAATYQSGLYTVGKLGSGKSKTGLDSKKIKSMSPFKSYLKKEYLVLLRTKAYSSNCFFINLIWPGLLVLFMNLNKGKASFNTFMEHYSRGEAKPLVIALIVVTLISFIASAMNSLASTAFTREGAHLDIIHYLPMDYKMQLWAKGFVSLSITYPALIACIVIWAIYTKASILTCILYAFVALLCLIITMIIGLYLDSAHPHNNWDDEYSALRGNLNSFFDMAIVIVISVIITGICFALFYFTSIGLVGFTAILCGVLIVLACSLSLMGIKATLNNMQNLTIKYEE